MKSTGLLFCLILLFSCNQYESHMEDPIQHSNPIYFGDIKPQGWILDQMQEDLEKGFVGHLDQLVPDLILEDDIYGEDRLTRQVKSKDVGVAVTGEDWEVEFLWWNSETQSNWWDGFIRHAILTENTTALKKVNTYVTNKLGTQDEDGYLGIYAEDLRYQHRSENGELWAQTTLLRGLLAYYEAFQSPELLQAIERAVQRTMLAYPINQSTPFRTEKQSGGLSHGLTFVDVLDRLYQITGKPDYRDYAVFLYRDFDRYEKKGEDVLTKNMLDPDYRFTGHGVHTFEHLRPLTLAAYYAQDTIYREALEGYLEKLAPVLTPSGAPIGDEWVGKRHADANTVGYEYCSLHELLDSYSLLLQKSRQSSWADKIEWLLFNAAQGARHPEESAIAYCKTDNSYHMLGDLHLERQQHTHYKYSPAHQDVAVCCVPNAGRIYPYYVQSMWRRSEQGLVADLFGPSVLTTEVGGKKVSIIQQTDYPFDLAIQFLIETEAPVSFEIAVRKPAWAKKVNLNSEAGMREDEQYLYLEKTWSTGDEIQLGFEAEPLWQQDSQGLHFITYGPLVFALPLKGDDRTFKTYPVKDFRDIMYEPTIDQQQAYQWFPKAPFKPVKEKDATNDPWQKKLKLEGVLFDPDSSANTAVSLYPMGGTVLRKVCFEGR